MAHITWPILDQLNTDGSLGLGAAESWSNGDVASRGIWMDGLNNAISDLQYNAKATANGEILAGDAATHTYKKHVPAGTGGITVTAGAGTLDFSIGAGAIATDRLTTHARTQFVHSLVELNLSGGAASSIPIFKPDISCTLISAYLEFTVAAGSVAAAVSIGKPGNATYYLNALATATGGSQWDKQSITLLANDIAADQSVFCSTDGAGDAGKVLVYLTYTVD